MQRLFTLFFIVLLFIIVGELTYLFVFPKKQSAPDNVATLLKSIPRRQLFLVLNQIEIAGRNTTKSSVLTAKYEGTVRKIISTPNAKTPYPRVQFIINEGKNKVTAAYTDEELSVVTTYKKNGTEVVKATLDDIQENALVQIDEEFDIKNNRLLKTTIRIL